MLDTEHDLVQNGIRRRTQIVNLLDHVQLEPDQLVLVVLVHDVLLQALLILREVLDQQVKLVTARLRKGVVVHGHHRGGSLEFVHETNLTEMLSSLECVHYLLLAYLVTHSHLALTLANVVKVELFLIVGVILFDDVGMGQFQADTQTLNNGGQQLVHSLLALLLAGIDG